MSSKKSAKITIEKSDSPSVYYILGFSDKGAESGQVLAMVSSDPKGALEKLRSAYGANYHAYSVCQHIA